MLVKHTVLKFEGRKPDPCVLMCLGRVARTVRLQLSLALGGSPLVRRNPDIAGPGVDEVLKMLEFLTLVINRD